MARRVGPVPDSPTTVVETPPSPSTTTFGHSPSAQPTNNNQSTYSSDSNVKPSDILRNKKLAHTQHTSIAKSAQNSSSESLINSTNNEETLHVESYPISERVSSSKFSFDYTTNTNLLLNRFFCFCLQIKSYESISSLSSDGLKAIASANNTSANSSHGILEHNNSAGHADHEPYYDTVPIEETDDEIEAEESALHKLETQNSLDLGGHVGERVSNYININYFLS